MKVLERLFVRRPRILNQLHRFCLVSATSQTNEEELNALARHASGKRWGVEIGTHQGVSAVRIAAAMAADGVLYCVDPWPEIEGRANSCWSICERHLRRTGAADRIKIVRGLSAEVESEIPHGLDFAFIDGDHSRGGLETDWNIVSPRLCSGGVVCMHDTVIPVQERWRSFGSVAFFADEIANDRRFELVETVYSMTVLRKR